eukprot:CAMPEP_0194305194 /NCGR_PEP_ID=MMETSP0171-20130528/2687_1 /TAXON_ID=218684 /ORGANISM="Corethron pennatum, Strain L29A3" /LENGTH=157 /DNA_ID=CAMNT_0039056647 /DNA_START=153 /DNA_END=623 /DNA_ORIENTATION=+
MEAPLPSHRPLRRPLHLAVPLFLPVLLLSGCAPIQSFRLDAPRPPLRAAHRCTTRCDLLPRSNNNSQDLPYLPPSSQNPAGAGPPPGDPADASDTLRPSPPVPARPHISIADASPLDPSSRAAADDARHEALEGALLRALRAGDAAASASALQNLRA